MEYRGDYRALISGHPRFCPDPVEVIICGSTWGGSLLKQYFIGRGMHLEVMHPAHQRIVTSRIVEIRDLTRPPVPRRIRPGSPGSSICTKNPGTDGTFRGFF
jgi:hypothetical protein